MDDCCFCACIDNDSWWIGDILLRFLKTKECREYTSYGFHNDWNNRNTVGIWGYSLAFGPDATGNGFIGTLDWVGLNNVLHDVPSDVYGGLAGPTIPHQTYMVFQMMFAIITPALIVAALAERMKWSAFVIFIILWATFVYDFCCPLDMVSRIRWNSCRMDWSSPLTRLRRRNCDPHNIRLVRTCHSAYAWAQIGLRQDSDGAA